MINRKYEHRGRKSIFETPLLTTDDDLSLPAGAALRQISVAGVDDGPEVGVEGGQGEGDEDLRSGGSIQIPKGFSIQSYSSGLSQGFGDDVMINSPG